MNTLFQSTNLTDHYIDKYPNTPGVYIFTTQHRKNGYVKAKIGATSALPVRLHKKELESGDVLTVYHFIPCQDMQHAYGLETILHNEYKYQKTRGEWFNLHPEDLRLLSKCENQHTWWRELYPDGEIQRVRALKAMRNQENRA